MIGHRAILETLNATAPFVGPIGTVWAIGLVEADPGAGSVDIALVVGANLAGLIVAILAPIGYNFIGKRGGRSWNTQAPV